MRRCRDCALRLPCPVIAPAWAAGADDAPDIVYFNGKIVTMDAADTIAEAVAIRDGRFVGIRHDRRDARHGRPGHNAR